MSCLCSPWIRNISLAFLCVLWHWCFGSMKDHFCIESPSIHICLCVLVVKFRCSSGRNALLGVLLRALRQDTHVHCPFISDGNFDLLVKVVSVRFFNFKVTVFPFVISNLCGETQYVLLFLIKLWYTQNCIILWYICLSLTLMKC